jgi:ubiquinone/menaquinone biosynthesis C-methylase UbiE
LRASPVHSTSINWFRGTFSVAEACAEEEPEKMPARRYDDEAERRNWQRPEPILVEIGLCPGLAFIDVGCGESFFAIPAARIVGNDGKVYALDSDAVAISSLEEKASKNNLKNIETRARTIALVDPPVTQ